MKRWFPPLAVWGAYAVHIVVVGVAVMISARLPQHVPAGFINPLIGTEPYIVDKLIKWDAHWYIYIAEAGYTAQSLVFFPATVIVIKLLALSGISYAKAGLLACNIFAFLSFWALYVLFRLDASGEQAFKAVLFYGLMPTSFFLNSVYTEPLFITFAAVCLYFGRKGCWWRSGISAALAALTRNVGIILVVPMVIEWAIQTLYKREKHSWVPLLLPIIAITAFMAYNYVLTGDMLEFVHAQSGWGREWGLPWVNLWKNIVMNTFLIPDWEPGRFLDTIMVVSALIGLIIPTLSARYSVRPSYLIMAWLWLMLPLVSTSAYYPLYSLSRFVLVIFPLYIIVAKLSTGYYYLSIISAVLLLLCSAWFVNGYWIG